jgi:hypothetical protein
MGFLSFADIGRRAAANMHWAYVFKPTVPAQGAAGFFIDLNQSSGVPKYNPFSGSALTATELVGIGNLGVYAGNFLSGRSKHLLSMQFLQLTAANGPPDYVYLLDYLMFYALVDTDDQSEQVMDNPITLPRYNDGRIVLIVQSPLASTAPMTITYTNQDGVSGRTATANIIPGTAIGLVASGIGTGGGAGQATPFFPLADGDSGVRSIQSVTMLGSGGGFVCAAIVKPLATLPILEASVSLEKQLPIFGQYPPEIKEGACLNFIIQRGGTGTGAYRAELLFVNS